MGKQIRFIDSDYHDLFRIPDGESISVKYPDGHTENRLCKYIDDYHTEINGVCYHICQWAELMEQNGRTYFPAKPPEYTLENITPDEFEFMYAAEDETADRGCIGHLRADFDMGKSFYHSWWSENDNLKTPEFREEFDKVISYFRNESYTPFLKSRADMNITGIGLKATRSKKDKDVYGFKVITEKHTYYFRCNPRAGEYNLYAYCYNKEMLNRYKDLQFAKKNYDRLNRDKFYVGTSSVTQTYYNPDATTGGQLVELTISFDDIKEAAKMYKNPNEFFSYLEAVSKGSLYDVGTGNFREAAQAFIEGKADFEGCTGNTMQQIKKIAGFEHTKSHKTETLER